MKKILGVILIATVLLSSTPLSVLAQTTYDGISGGDSSDTTSSQASELRESNESGQAGTGEDGEYDEAASEGIAGCISGVVSSMITNYITGMISSSSNSEVPTSEAKYRSKETGIAGSGISWDKIGYCVANALIQYIAQSTINWINSGFDGAPAFVENPEMFFKDIANREAGALIEELGGDFLCSGIKPKVQLAILQNHRNTPYNQRSKCTLTGIVDNIENFGDDFSNGGWQGWIELTQVPQNTSAGAYRIAEDELLARTSVKLGANEKQLDWGRGYLSFKDEDGNTQTPGQVIETQVSQTFGLAKDRLVLADEFDEIVTALVNALIKIALNESLGNN